MYYLILGLKFLFLLSIFGGYFYCTYRKLKVCAAFIPIFVFSTITCFLFFMGAFNLLKLGVYFISLTGLIFFGGFIFQLIKRNYCFQELICFPFIFFILSAVYFFIMLKGVQFLHYDNFSHWGLILKEMMYFDSLPDFRSIIYFRNYPPGMAIFNFYICKILGFSESHALVGQAWFLTAAATAFFYKKPLKNKGIYYIITLLLITILLAIIDQNFYNLLIDTMLGFMPIACILITYYYRNDLRRSTLFNLPLYIFLILLKDSGKVFFVVVFVFQILTMIRFYFFDRGEINHKNGIQKQMLTSFLLLLLLPIFINVIWGAYTEKAYPTTGYSENKFAVSSEKIIKNLEEKSEEFKESIGIKFLKRAVDLDFHCVKIILISNISILLMMLIYFLMQQKKPKLLFLTFLFTNFVLLFYLFGQYLMYLCLMPESEATNLDSFDRYYATITIFVVGIQFLSMIHSGTECIAKGNKAPASVVAVEFITLLLTAVLLIPSYSYYFRRPDYEESKRAVFEDPVKIYGEHVGRDQSVLCYTGTIDDKNGYLYWLMRYSLLTSGVMLCDENTLLDNQNVMIKNLKERDYLLIGQNTQKIWSYLEQYNVEFYGETQGVLYKVNVDQGIKLLKVE